MTELSETIKEWAREENVRVMDEVAAALRVVMDGITRASAGNISREELEAFAAATAYQDRFCGMEGTTEGNKMWSSFLAGAAWERARRRT